MLTGARRLTTIAAGAVLFALASPVAFAPAAGATVDPGSTKAVRAPAPGSEAARSVGGPLMATSGTVVRQPATKLPNVPASAFVVANADTGQVLAAKDPHGTFAPASTLKVLTAITLIPLLNPNASVVASKLATSQQPNIAGLVAGHRYKVADLFRALLLISANDAAVALTEATGSFARGMDLINAEARRLQAYDVDAKLPNGLPASGQVVSAYDEALIARQALGIPAFMAYDQTLSSPFQVKPGQTETMVNENYLLTRYPGGIGGKIGWTRSSQATYIGLARRGGVTLIVTVLHCTAQQEITAAEKLLNWGFANNGKATPVGTLVAPLASAPAPAVTTTDPAPAAASPAAVAAAPRQAGVADAQPRGGSAGAYVLAAAGVVGASLGVSALIMTRKLSGGRRLRPRRREAG